MTSPSTVSGCAGLLEEFIEDLFSAEGLQAEDESLLAGLQ